LPQSKDAVQLCALLVDETYGELTSHGLIVLIQQNLVYYCEDDDSQTTYYEANQGAAYALIRSGKILEVVESRYGDVARELVQNLFLMGHAKVGDLIDSYLRNRKPPTNGASNTLAELDAQQHSPARLDSILCKLLEATLLQPATHLSFRSPDDTYNEVEQKLLRDEFSGSTKGTKQKEQLKSRIRETLESMRSEGQNWKLKCSKRKFDGELSNGTNGSAKRRRFSNGSFAVNGNHAHDDESLRLDRDLVIRINYEKFTVTLRNMRLVELAHTRIGETTSHVYSELLRLLEEYIPRCRPDPRIDNIEELPDGPTITTVELAAGMSSSINVAVGIGKAPSDKINISRILKSQSSKRRHSDAGSEAEVEGEASADEEGSDEYALPLNGNRRSNFVVGDESDSHGEEAFAPDGTIHAPKRAKVTFQEKLPKPAEPENPQDVVALLKSHLILLAADEYRFLRRCGSRGHGEWTVDFDRLVHYLQQSELDSVILENFDVAGHRLARMMRKMGKMDEKHLSAMALMKQKDVRTKLAEMQMAGMADVQEVPKDASRANNRTIFLWHFDSERVSSIILQNVYKTMSRCFQRLEIERRRADGILSLTERSDVRDHVEEAFSANQMKMLREIRSKEDKLLGQVGRLDELVGTFGEY
ncbi:hypothetical protein OIDMADRAFT_126614, partial [Oidiodendron maius Zn]